MAGYTTATPTTAATPARGASVANLTKERPRAPGSLALLQAFVNTVDLESGRESLSTPQALGAWLADHGFEVGRALGVADLRRALDLREALRDSLEANAHPPAPRAGLATDGLTRAAASIPLRVVASPTGPRLEGAGDAIDEALGAILAVAVEATAGGSWPRLKVCRNDACRWAYWDASRNRSGAWCSMAICGNRAKGRAFRQRRGSG